MLRRPRSLIVLQGESQVTTSNGNVPFGPGSVVLLDIYTTGKEHQTRAVGKLIILQRSFPLPRRRWPGSEANPAAAAAAARHHKSLTLARQNSSSGLG